MEQFLSLSYHHSPSAGSRICVSPNDVSGFFLGQSVPSPLFQYLQLFCFPFRFLVSLTTSIHHHYCSVSFFHHISSASALYPLLFGIHHWPPTIGLRPITGPSLLFWFYLGISWCVICFHDLFCFISLTLLLLGFLGYQHAADPANSSHYQLAPLDRAEPSASISVHSLILKTPNALV